MKKIIALLMLVLIVKVYSGGSLIGFYRINHMRDILHTEKDKYVIDCIDAPKRCEVVILGPAVLMIEEEKK